MVPELTEEQKEVIVSWAKANPTEDLNTLATNMGIPINKVRLVLTKHLINKHLRDAHEKKPKKT